MYTSVNKKKGREEEKKTKGGKKEKEGLIAIANWAKEDRESQRIHQDTVINATILITLATSHNKISRANGKEYKYVRYHLLHYKQHSGY